MGKSVDYSKIKALSQQILECIGDYSEGEDPSIPEPDTEVEDGGVEPNVDFLKTSQAQEDETGVGDGKKKKKASIAMMASMLSSKVKGNAQD